MTAQSDASRQPLRRSQHEPIAEGLRLAEQALFAERSHANPPGLKVHDDTVVDHLSAPRTRGPYIAEA